MKVQVLFTKVCNHMDHPDVPEDNDYRLCIEAMNNQGFYINGQTIPETV